MAGLRRKLSLHALKVATVLAMAAAALPATADTPYLGEIRVFGFDFCPRGWAATEGQILAISQNSALFSLLGATYGGNGSTTFQLIDARGRSMIGAGTGAGLAPKNLGDKGGQQTVTLTTLNLPSHSHLVNANNLDGDKAFPGGNLLAAAPPSGAGSETIYSTQPATVAMSPLMIALAGGGQPMSVQDPYLATTVCIALQGIFPSRP